MQQEQDLKIVLILLVGIQIKPKINFKNTHLKMLLNNMLAYHEGWGNYKNYKNKQKSD